MFQNAWWIGLPAHELSRKNILQGDLNGRFAYYRCTFEAMAGAALTTDISANARYRLWVNGKPVLSGPCKGDLNRHYYDTVELTDYLQPGRNVLALQVLFADHYATIFQEHPDSPIFSLAVPGGTHRLALEGTVHNPDGSCTDLTTGKAEWKCCLDVSRRLRSQIATQFMGGTLEQIDFSAVPHGWKAVDFDDSAWGTPEALETVLTSDYMRAVGLVPRFPMYDRPIPLLYETEACFDDYGALLGAVTVKGGTQKRFMIAANVEVNGFPRFHFTGGKGSKITITYLEKFIGGATKIDPSGEVDGIFDQLTLDGSETCFEPFWYRTFRFILLDVEAVEDTTVHPPVYRKTGYPLEVKAAISSGEKWAEDVFDICVRTLENCMMDTYMDCPYYEQNQFPMDTRLQALFCSAVSGDMRLTYKALEDFHCSITPDGLVHGRYPASYQQIISTFSLYYIFMLEETWQQTGDMGPLRRYLPDLDRILGYYDARIGSDGLVGRLGWWEFVDWQEKWGCCGGIPEACLHGPSTIINLMYALALERAAILWEAAGRRETARECRARKDAVNAAVFRLCWDEAREMLREGPAFEQFTQHAQAWAVLTGALEGQQAKAALRRAIDGSDVLKCSFSTAFEWFRALEKAEMYAETEQYMMGWAALIPMGNTTCPETPGDARSECHAWSALPIYEFLRVMGGVRMEAGKPVITPTAGYLADLDGTVPIPGGCVRFRWRNGSYEYKILK